MTALIVFYLLFPLIVIRLCLRFESMNKIGAVFVCYVVGAALGNSGGLPDGSAALQDTLSGATVAIALPLLLFSMDVKAWVKTAGKAILSMTGATIIIVAVAGLGSVIIADYVEDSWKLAGLAISVYTGGTPNMAAIKTALDVDPTTYIIMHTYDILINLIYLIFSITLAQKFFNRFLPRFEKVKNMISDRGNEEIEDINSYRNMLNVSIIKKLMVAMVLSFVILGVSLGTAALFPKAYSTSVTILMITSLGIGASFFTKIRQIEKT